MIQPNENQTSAIRQVPAAASAIVGIARRDITPPVGIYSRMWGAANHDISQGTHKPLCVTAITIRATENDTPLVLMGVDLALLGDLGNDADEVSLMRQVTERTGIPRANFIVNCSHTHAAPWAASSRIDKPGGDLIPAYLQYVGQAMCEAVREALVVQTPSVITWAKGRCNLAINRDLPDPDKSKARVVCGFNPANQADDTVMVGRITRDSDSTIIGTIVNYACHPTTLAWLNRLISPDFIGGMREVVEANTGNAPCVYLQGASGELSPAHQYTGDLKVADRHGRRLGFAALSALESLEGHRKCLAYKGVQESGAPLAVWWPETFTPDSTISSQAIQIPLPIRPMPSLSELQTEHDKTTDRVMRERLFRKMQIVKSLDESGTKPTPAWVWRIGSALIIAHPNEAYSRFQQDLRAAFPGYAVVVMNVSGSEVGYICPPELYQTNIYQVWQTPFDQNALPVLTEHCINAAKKLTEG